MAKKEEGEEPEVYPFEDDIYHGEKHTVLLWIHSEESDEQEWHELDFRSEIEDPKEALFDYIAKTFGDDIDIEELGDDTYRVDDPLFNAGECLRDYKLS